MGTNQVLKQQDNVMAVQGGDLDREQLAAVVPLRRLGTPEDVAATVAFLFSGGADYITGQVIQVNGGVS